MSEETGLQAWLVPVFVTAAIILVEAAVWLVTSRRRPARPAGNLADRRAQTMALGLLVLLALAVAGMASLGPNLADQLASVVAALLGGVSAFLTYLSYKSTQTARKENGGDKAD
ncbi:MULTISPECIES: hypothetical protein [Actinoplanes]|uniref:Uncharacterized protein n=2 Tax=Actinoplanes TaxID=1865 RepID=A0A0X3VG87_9ACTN|nr:MULTISPECIES: hypothetical protein [Actinoplanes]KUL42396.1 hypothetical protein ADL15_00475 [Actinoplanes awajinensis subsp. mycoplanecinus]GIE64730.1 hypothetical protein Apa02nite_008380 [Actinoplanes palleronii]